MMYHWSVIMMPSPFFSFIWFLEKQHRFFHINLIPVKSHWTGIELAAMTPCGSNHYGEQLQTCSFGMCRQCQYLLTGHFKKEKNWLRASRRILSRCETLNRFTVSQCAPMLTYQQYCISSTMLLLITIFLSFILVNGDDGSKVGLFLYSLIEF